MRVTSALLFATRSRKPGSWWLKPLWSCRQTVDVSMMFSDGTGHARAHRVTFQPFRVLVEHRVDHVDKGLVGC